MKSIQMFHAVVVYRYVDAAFWCDLSEPSRFHFLKPENYISMYHPEGTNTIYVGGQAVIYVLTFTDRRVRDQQVHLHLFFPHVESLSSTKQAVSERPGGESVYWSRTL